MADHITSNKLFRDLLSGYEAVIRKQYRLEISMLQKEGDPEWNETRWNEWCDQDEFVTCLETVINDYEELSQLMSDDHHGEDEFGQAYLNKLFELEALLLGFTIEM